ncbi:hypothetical protein D1818_23675 [Aquimarina sp. BL5]|uniref:hypothetical protein n=1 Tax=Aquimarina sp. BL5 TaxID=1714860 RepID=UPI000E468A27|nr:hypothetical protein [Aquimarina sp. BL5]AXT53678.1 hypothetical protein D1818_23675 [Aquimarina sp. BL5]RKN02798.1 hypothetical protein D7036_15715 [Aquimarina sp. BL5]
MKSFKLILFLFFSLVLGSQVVTAQQTNTNAPEQYLPNSVKSKSIARTKVQTKGKNTNIVNTSETAKLYSKKEKEARALTARKSKESGKGNITAEQAAKKRDARIAAIIEANKTKKKTPSKRGNN